MKQVQERAIKRAFGAFLNEFHKVLCFMVTSVRFFLYDLTNNTDGKKIYFNVKLDLTKEQRFA